MLEFCSKSMGIRNLILDFFKPLAYGFLILYFIIKINVVFVEYERADILNYIYFLSKGKVVPVL
jgi:hypothetical protein